MFHWKEAQTSGVKNLSFYNKIVPCTVKLLYYITGIAFTLNSILNQFKPPNFFICLKVKMKFLYVLLILGIAAAVEAGGYGKRPRPRPRPSKSD